MDYLRALILVRRGYAVVFVINACDAKNLYFIRKFLLIDGNFLINI